MPSSRDVGNIVFDLLDLRSAIRPQKMKDARDEYVHVKSMEDAGGLFNHGISLVQHVSKKQFAICKKVWSDEAAKKEATVMFTLNGHPHIPELYDYIPMQALVAGNRTHSVDELYMEYCNEGPLADLLGHYCINNTVPIPEAFIWHVAESLLSALCFLHHGIRDAFAHEEGTPIPGDWIPIVHGDIHQDNVLLASSGDSSYPRILLADFGNAWLLLEMDSVRSFGTHSSDDIRQVFQIIADLCYMRSGISRYWLIGRILTGKTKPHWNHSIELFDVLKEYWIDEKEPYDAIQIFKGIQRKKSQLAHALVLTPLI